ncbi:YczE/YyaS/YitT family protein [Limosilactobacillus balticus]|uniref:YczE/YyaS/YitT family protein n=1 Tax=Limosilactobacillus balticus TaxID=2759747 RepID=UPI003995A89F
MKKKHSVSNLVWRTLMSFVGITILSLGTAFLRGGQVGLDPFTATNTGISGHLSMSLGVYQLLANAAIFIFILIMDRNKIGIGTLLNMVLVGFEVQWFIALYQQIFGTHANTIVIISDLIVGLILFTLGASMYMGADLGVAPYDAIAPILSDRLHTQYRTIRIAQDILFMIVAYFIGGPVGVGTVIVAFFTGPLITFWDNHVSLPMRRTIDNAQDMSAGRRVGYLLTRFGKSSYDLVSRSYELTNLMQRRLSQYSPKDIEDQLKITRRNMEIAKASYQSSERRYDMLRAELQRRKKQAATGPEAVKNQTEEG